MNISTHALTEGDWNCRHSFGSGDGFQLTPSRRATRCGRCGCRSNGNFNSRPHGGRLSGAARYCPRAYFNSRPHGGRLTPSYLDTAAENISTHALTEGDCFVLLIIFPLFHFNSRPHGGRLMYPFVTFKPENFNSRPHGGRQNPVIGAVKLVDISTHALTEGDPSAHHREQKCQHFNSRPHGGRR